MNDSGIPLRTYTREEAREATLAYFRDDELASEVWIDKYALKNLKGQLLERNPDDMHRRMASEIARIEAGYPNPLSEARIFELLKDFKYLVPQGSPMAGIGNPYQIASLSNCFVIGNEGASDSYGGIFKIDQEQVQLMKRRGGVGHDMSHIRPKGSPVRNSAQTATGLLPFMERYSNSTREVAQEGRRGALMLTVSINHPDAADFIDAKMQPGRITAANISVKIEDAFMNAVEEGGPYIQKFPVYSTHPKRTKRIDARELWKKIVHNAWKSAEPGILFWDTILRESVPDCYADLGFKTISTNPCGEIPLCPYDSCRLLAINLFSYVAYPFSPRASFNYELFKEHVAAAQRIMDDIVDLELEKINRILAKIEADPESDEIKAVERALWLKIREKTIAGRRSGIGITAEADMLAAMNMRYGSDEAIAFSVGVHKQLALKAYRASVDTARERGPFPLFDAAREKNNPFIGRLREASESLYKDMLKYGRRNIALLTIAPTGSVSLMTQTSSGIEPVFMPVYKRRRKVNPDDANVPIAYVDQQGDAWEEYTVLHRRFKQWMELQGYAWSPGMTNSDLKSLLQKSPYYKATSGDVDWVSKVRLQGAVQQWVDHSISVTINLPGNATESLVASLYLEAWKVGCKGVTVYREGSRSGVLLRKSPEEITQEHRPFPMKRPEILSAEVVRFKNSEEKWIAFIGLLEGKPYEIFTGPEEGKQGIKLPKDIHKGKILKRRDTDGTSCYDFQYQDRHGKKTTLKGLSYKFNPEYWNYAKLISGTLRLGMPIEKVVHLVKSLQLDSTSINTWKNGVARALSNYVPEGTLIQGENCNTCHSGNLIYREGCLTCASCGASSCE